MDDERGADISVLCVEDNADVAGMLEVLLGSEPGVRWVGRAVDPAAVLDDVARERPDIVLMDLSIPGVDTIELIRQVVGKHPDSGVLVFTGYDDPATVERVLDAGARGLVSKSEDPDGLLSAIRRAGRGECVRPL